MWAIIKIYPITYPKNNPKHDHKTIYATKYTPYIILGCVRASIHCFFCIPATSFLKLSITMNGIPLPLTVKWVSWHLYKLKIPPLFLFITVQNPLAKFLNQQICIDVTNLFLPSKNFCSSVLFMQLGCYFNDLMFYKCISEWSSCLGRKLRFIVDRCHAVCPGTFFLIFFASKNISNLVNDTWWHLSWWL